MICVFFFSSRRRHTRCYRDWSSDVCSSDLGYGAQAIQSVARDLAYDALAYCGGLENAPEAVAVLAAGRRLLGNEPETLRRVRDPAVLLPFLASRGWRVPRTLARDEARPAAGARLCKPVHGGGGQGVRVWHGQRLAPRQMLQEYVAGVSASAIFVADGRRSRLLACTEIGRASCRE